MKSSSGYRAAVIGSGKMARHFSHYLAYSGIYLRSWSRRDSSDLARALGDSETVILLIQDGAIEPFIIENAQALAGRTLVHFSGSLVSKKAHGMHPLMSFGSELYDLATYQKVPFVCEEDGPVLQDFFPRLPNPSYRIPAESKALYHSLCVMSGNFTTLLWQKFFSDLESRLGLPSKIALPYLQRVVENLEANPAGALTGPLKRGDAVTIEGNLAALSGDPYQRIYQAFVEAVHDQRA
jgi:predicted short-subunit dehydrogenase-like oxidoreductase (DUF2520 family)